MRTIFHFIYKRVMLCDILIFHYDCNNNAFNGGTLLLILFLIQNIDKRQLIDTKIPLKEKTSICLYLHLEYHTIVPKSISPTHLTFTFMDNPSFILNVKDNKCSGTLSLLSTSISNLSIIAAAIDFI